MNIPLFVYNAKNAPPSDYFQHNLDLHDGYIKAEIGKIIQMWALPRAYRSEEPPNREDFFPVTCDATSNRSN